jgi:predicted branched-subunit amino acid permease
MSRGIYRQERNTDGCSAIIRDGVAAAWPICLGYAPIGLAFGVLAQKAGLTPAEIGLMSLLVFAGSAQFIAVSMLSGGASDHPDHPYHQPAPSAHELLVGCPSPASER